MHLKPVLCPVTEWHARPDDWEAKKGLAETVLCSPSEAFTSDRSVSVFTKPQQICLWIRWCQYNYLPAHTADNWRTLAGQRGRFTTVDARPRVGSGSHRVRVKSRWVGDRYCSSVGCPWGLTVVMRSPEAFWPLLRCWKSRLSQSPPESHTQFLEVLAQAFLQHLTQWQRLYESHKHTKGL